MPQPTATETTRYIERVPGYRLRTRELRPQPGEHRRWVIVLNGSPLAIKRTVLNYVEVAGYRGYGSAWTDTVFCWRPESQQARTMVDIDRVAS